MSACQRVHDGADGLVIYIQLSQGQECINLDLFRNESTWIWLHFWVMCSVSLPFHVYCSPVVSRRSASK